MSNAHHPETTPRLRLEHPTMPTVTEPNPSPAESAAKLDPQASTQPALRIRYRIRFAKEGLLRWISHATWRDCGNVCCGVVDFNSQ